MAEDLLFNKLNSTQVKFELRIHDDSGLVKYWLMAFSIKKGDVKQIPIKTIEEVFYIQDLTKEKEVEIIKNLISVLYSRL